MFLTAFDEYAVKAFEEHAFDYLLKPIEAQRLEKTLVRLRQERSLQDISLLDDTQQALKYIPCTATAASGCCRWRMSPLSAAG
ncbi:Probable transcriptional regulatory protein YehT [Raoultella planticola]|uniref:Probable transcriptional regulatory protein YehT n=1 Tax=Raoultella planticola TaxID=575 RepID=A0A485AB90_RAOPL|nr:Probable transcriptional regulatory protein YehT [Raoultella planticola]